MKYIPIHKKPKNRFRPLCYTLLFVIIYIGLIYFIDTKTVVEVTGAEISEYTFNVNPAQNTLFKITCFTGYECRTKHCQSGNIKRGDVALNPKYGKNKTVFIPEFQRYYNADWISDSNTDIDIWFGDTYADYLKCLDFGVMYSHAKVLPVDVDRIIINQ